MLDWRDSEPVLVDGPTGHSLSLGADGRLWCRMVKSGTVLVGIIENGSIKPLAEGPAGGNPSAN